MFPWAIALCAALANAILAGIVLRHGPRQPINRLFCFGTATVVFWNLNLFSLYFFREAEDAAYWSTVFRTGTLLMPPAVAHLLLLFGGHRGRAVLTYLIFAYGLATVLICANALNLLTYGVRPHAWGYYPVPTPVYNLHVFSVIVNFGFAMAAMISNLMRASEPQKRLQARFWLVGVGIGVAGGITNLFPLYHWRVLPLGSVANVLYSSIIGYAIVRHRLMDIDIVLTKGLAYVGAGALVGLCAFLVVVMLENWAFGVVHYDFAVAVLVVAAVAARLFVILRVRIEGGIERSFFRQKHEYRRALLALAKGIIRVVDADRLAVEMGRGLERIVGADRVAIYFRAGEEGALRLAYVVGGGRAREGFERGAGIVRYLEGRGEGVLKSEVEGEAALFEAFAEGGWEVCVPLTAGGGVVGFFALGRKRSGEGYGVAELELFDTLGAQAGTALENVRLSEELQRSREIIQRAGRMSALGTLAAGIAHEIRNPLVSIQTFFQLAPERLQDREFVTSFLALAEGEVKRIADLVSELLTFARPQTQGFKEMDVDGAIDGILRLLMPESVRRRVKLVRSAGEAVPLVRADPDRIKQVLVNIVLNAIQATEAGGVVSVAARVSDVAGGRFCRIEVRDTGVGIPVEAREEIFNPFFTTKEKGTGLGLSIAHQIVAEHGGFISVESREGEGSCFAIHLPIVEGGVAVSRLRSS